MKITQEEEQMFKPLEGLIAEMMEQRDPNWIEKIKERRKTSAVKLMSEIRNTHEDDLCYLINDDPNRAVRMLNTLILALEAEYDPDVDV